MKVLTKLDHSSIEFAEINLMFLTKFKSELKALSSTSYRPINPE